MIIRDQKFLARLVPFKALQKDRSSMAMPQRDDWIEEIKRLDALLEYAVMHGDEEEAEHLRATLRKLTEAF